MVCWFRSRSRALKASPAPSRVSQSARRSSWAWTGRTRFAQQGGEGALVLGDPGLDVVEAVVALRDEEEEPDGQDLARGERAFPVERGGEVAVQGGRQVQTLEGGPQDGQVGHDFHTQQAGFGGVHPSSLPTSAFPENHPEHERTAG